MWTNLRHLALAITLCGSVARADEWTKPTARTLGSPDHKLEAVITPSADGKLPANATIGPKGHAGRTFALAARWMPVDAVLFDDGSLLTLDDWHQLGYGKVATVYERDGKVRWAKTLVELVGQAMVDRAQHSVSSIWWRKMPLEWSLAKDGESGLVTLVDENQLKLSLRDGGGTIVAVASLPEEPERLLNRARALADQPAQEAAVIALLERVIAKEPDLLEAVSLYVSILQRGNDHARVVALLDRESPRWTVKEGYNLANVRIAWATSLMALSRASEAERVLQLAIDAAPGYTNPAIALATLLVDRGRPKDADAALDAFVGRLVKAPNLDTYALAEVADFYKRRKRLAKALDLYQKGYRRDQVTNQFLYASLASLHEEMGNDVEAIRIDEQLLAYFQKMGAPFDSYTKTTRDELARLHAKKP